MKNKLIALIACMICILSVNAQEFETCKANPPIFVRAEKGAVYNGSLRSFFDKVLEDVKLNDGDTIKVNILISDDGSACCSAIKSKLSEQDIQFIKKSIDGMQGWSPAIQNGFKVNFWACIELYMRKNKIVVAYTNKNPLQPRR